MDRKEEDDIVKYWAKKRLETEKAEKERGMTYAERFPTSGDEGEELETTLRRRRKNKRAREKDERESRAKAKKTRDEEEQKRATQIYWKRRRKALKRAHPEDQLRENIEILLDDFPQMSKVDRERHLRVSQQSWSASPSDIQTMLARYPTLGPRAPRDWKEFSIRQHLSEDDKERIKERAQRMKDINQMEREEYRSTWEGSEDQKLGIGPEREAAHPTGSEWIRHEEPKIESESEYLESNMDAPPAPFISPDEMRERERATVHGGPMRDSSYLRHYFNKEGFLVSKPKEEGGIEYTGDPYRRLSPLPEEGAASNTWRGLQEEFPMEYMEDHSAVRYGKGTGTDSEAAKKRRVIQRSEELFNFWAVREYEHDDEPEDFLVDTKEIVDARIARLRQANEDAHTERLRQERRAKEGEERE